MKIWLWAFLAIVIGGAIGGAYAVMPLGFSAGELPSPQAVIPPRSATPGDASPETRGIPKVVVEQEVFDFGTMDAKEEKKHAFVVRNEGDGLLEIENQGTSCKCAMSDFTTRTIGPGKSTKITLTWTAKEYFGPYEQRATIHTNDPEQPKITLAVKGRVTAALRSSPPEVVFSEMPAGQRVESKVYVFAYRSDELALTDVSLEDASTAEYFDVASSRLSAEQLAAEKDAKSGYELVITIKPGLPLGRFRQTILVDTNLPKDARLEIPIKGKVVSDFSIVGRDWNEERQTLSLGILPPGEGAERTLFLVVRGRYHRSIDVEVAEVFPPQLLTAELGEPTGVGSGSVTRIPLRIRVAKESGSANYLGSRQTPSGHVILNTNHPQAPHIKALVSFAVEGE